MPIVNDARRAAKQPGTDTHHAIPLSRRQLARESAGLTLEAAAAQARVSPFYLRAIEREVRTASFGLAQRLASIYGCRIDLFVSANQPTKGTARR